MKIQRVGRQTSNFRSVSALKSCNVFSILLRLFLICGFGVVSIASLVFCITEAHGEANTYQTLCEGDYLGIFEMCTRQRRTSCQEEACGAYAICMEISYGLSVGSPAPSGYREMVANWCLAGEKTTLPLKADELKLSGGL